jgi:hypothetical protein
MRVTSAIWLKFLALCLFALLLPDLCITFAAIDWPVPAGLEWYFRFFATLGANSRKHLASLGRTTILVGPLCPARLATGRTPLRLIGVALGAEELLLFGAKGELDATFDTLKCLVLGNHTG